MLGSIIGAIGGLAGSIFGANQQEDMAKDFAKKGIQWRVADAKKAGIHPLYALGANVSQAPSISVGDYGLGAAGQALGGAIEKNFTHEGKAAAAMTKLALERAGLENELIKSQIAVTRQAGQPPARPGGSVVGVIDGQNDAIPMKVVPPQRTSHMQTGLPYTTNPNFVDAQSVEDRYGDSELLSMATAVVNGGADAYYNLAPTVRRTLDRVVSDLAASGMRDWQFIKSQWKFGSRNYSRGGR